MDGVDAVLLAVGKRGLRVEAHAFLPPPHGLPERLRALAQGAAVSLEELAEADRRVGEWFAEAALALLARAHLSPERVTAIGSHGQTVRHRPPSAGKGPPFSLQLGDPNLIAARTGITTVADFRRKDLALGGEGAPLVPAFHAAAFAVPGRNRVVVNIGGIANLTWLPGRGNAVTGFDTGPGNCLMDAWTRRHLGRPFDADGAFAARGRPDRALLEALLRDPWFSLPPPKSTGPDHFHLDWLERHLPPGAHPADVQATLLWLTVESVARGIATACRGEPVHEVLLCGGGARNGALVAALSERLAPAGVATTAACGVDPLHVEAAAFAWLAHRTLARLPGNLPPVTGAHRPAVLGGIYFP